MVRFFASEKKIKICNLIIASIKRARSKYLARLIIVLLFFPLDINIKIYINITLAVKIRVSSFSGLSQKS